MYDEVEVMICIPTIAASLVTLEVFGECLVREDSVLVGYRVVGLFHQMMLWLHCFSCLRAQWVQWMRHETKGVLVFVSFLLGIRTCGYISAGAYDPELWCCYLRVSCTNKASSAGATYVRPSKVGLGDCGITLKCQSSVIAGKS